MTTIVLFAKMYITGDNFMYKITCPICNSVREVHNKPKVKGISEPFVLTCNRCCQKKPKSEETKRKLSESCKNAWTEEMKDKHSEYMKSHPEIWKNNLNVNKGENK